MHSNHTSEQDAEAACSYALWLLPAIIVVLTDVMEWCAKGESEPVLPLAKHERTGSLSAGQPGPRFMLSELSVGKRRSNGSARKLCNPWHSGGGDDKRSA
jgi:hypothetical protein